MSSWLRDMQVHTCHTDGGNVNTRATLQTAKTTPVPGVCVNSERHCNIHLLCSGKRSLHQRHNEGTAPERRAVPRHLPSVCRVPLARNWLLLSPSSFISLDYWLLHPSFILINLTRKHDWMCHRISLWSFFFKQWMFDAKDALALTLGALKQHSSSIIIYSCPVITSMMVVIIIILTRNTSFP